MFSPNSSYFPFLDGTVLLTGLPSIQLPLPGSKTGNLSLKITVPNASGVPAYLQALGLDGKGGLLASNGMEIIIYP